MKTVLYTIIFAFLMASCGSSNQVSNNRLLQKRKFNKGWHWSGRSVKNSKEKVQDAENTTAFIDTKKRTSTLAPQKQKALDFEKSSGKDETVALTSNEFKVDGEPKEQQVDYFLDTEEVETIEQEFNEKTEVKETEEVEKRINGEALAIIGLILVLLGLLIFFALVDSFAILGAGALLVLLGLLLLQKGLKKLKSKKELQDPDRQNTNNLVKRLFIFGVLGLNASAVLLLLTIEYSFAWMSGIALGLSIVLLVLGFIHRKRFKESSETKKQERRLGLVLLISALLIFAANFINLLDWA